MANERKLYDWWVEDDFWWVTPSVLGISAVVLAVLDAVDQYTSDYRMWAVGCVVAMPYYSIHVGPKS